MAYGIQLITPPSVEPVTLAELKAFARVDIADDDALITDLGVAAREYAEEYLQRQLITATWAITIDRFPLPGNPSTWQTYSFGIWQSRLPNVNLTGSWFPDRAALFIPKSPCQSVSSIQYVDSAGMQQTLASSFYIVDTISEPARLVPSFGNSWPIVRQQANAITITFVAGYGASGSAVPSRAKLAIKMLAAHWYEHREAVGDAPTAEVGMAVHSLLDSLWTGHYT